MRKFILSFVCLFVFAGLALAGQGQTKRNYMYNLPKDINWGNYQQVNIDLPATSTSSVLATTAISTATLVANGTSYVLADGDITDVITPRNLVADIYFATGEATTTVSGSLVVIGVDQFGNTATETLTISTTAVSGAVCWSSVTSLTFSNFTITGASEANCSLSVGVGTVIGLTNNIENSTDILKVIEAGATSTSYTVNTTYDSIDFASDPDGSKDYYIYFIGRTNDSRYKY